jgi:1-acyl-sn-glycerol-3-phosphate acyltransferase
MDKFADIRPYYDNEVDAIIKSIISDDEFIRVISNFKLSHIPEFIRPTFNPLLRFLIKRQVKGVNTVADFQHKVVGYVEHMVETTMTRFTISGIENLDAKKAYLFVGNHRDITLDPTFLNYARFLNNGDTVRIAVGDNLLSKEFISHLIRINKSFVVKRSEKAPRKLLEALKTLSEYIGHSILNDNQSVWIAQREGRAKDGLDKTDPTIIKMFAIYGRKQGFSEYIKSLNIVPVSISYEYDPCDVLKAKELQALATTGKYIKEQYEDITSIATGISGYKGHVHLAFGTPLDIDIEKPEDVALWLDEKIIDLYVLHPSNFFAYQRLYGDYPEGVYSEKALAFDINKLLAEKDFFDERINGLPVEIQPFVLQAYANPIVNKRNVLGRV